MDDDKVTYFDSFGVEYIPKETKKFISGKSITTNIYRMQAYDSIKCGYFCIEFIGFMLNTKRLADFTILFSPRKLFKNVMH